MEYPDKGLAVEYALMDYKLRIDARRTAAREPRLRNLRQNRIEGFAQVHGASRTCIVIPGFSSRDACSTAPMT